MYQEYRIANNYTGSVDIYRYDNESDSYILSQSILGSGQSERFGFSVDVSFNGDYVAVGTKRGYKNNSAVGHVKVYENVDGNYQQFGLTLNNPSNAYTEFGHKIHFEENSKRIIVSERGWGGGNDDGRALIYEFNESTNGWKLITIKII